MCRPTALVMDQYGFGFTCMDQYVVILCLANYLKSRNTGRPIWRNFVFWRRLHGRPGYNINGPPELGETEIQNSGGGRSPQKNSRWDSSTPVPRIAAYGSQSRSDLAHVISQGGVRMGLAVYFWRVSQGQAPPR